MARITFNPDSPIQALSGTVGNLNFRTIGGRTYVFERSEPTLPKNPTRKQRAQFKKRTIINYCIAILQSRYKDIQEAISMRSKIRDRLSYLYDRFVTDIKAPTKLQRAIISEYYARFSETLPDQSRRFIGTSSDQSRTQTPKSHENNDISEA